MYLIKRKFENFYIYAYEPTDTVKIINPPAFQGTSYLKDQICTVVQGRPRPMERNNVKGWSYLIQGNKSKDYPLQVATFEIAPSVPLTPDEYKVLVAEWEKNQMINLLLQGARNDITD
jgi:hypothetical protein